MQPTSTTATPDANAIRIGDVTEPSPTITEVRFAYHGGHVRVTGDFLPVVMRAAGHAASAMIAVTAQAEIAMGMGRAVAFQKRWNCDHARRIEGNFAEISAAFNGVARGLVEIRPRRGCPRWLSYDVRES